MLLVTHLLDPGMKYLASLTPLNNPVTCTDRAAIAFNDALEKTALFVDFISGCHEKSYSIRTREAYWGWIKRFILFHRKRDPSEMGQTEIEQFLVHLELHGHATASTRNQAMSALQFLYREVLHLHFDWVEKLARVKSPTQLPRVLTTDEMSEVLSGLGGSYWLMASLLNCTGIQVLECVRLRVKDVSIARSEIQVRDGKGELVRCVKIPQELQKALERHMEKVFEEHGKDMKSNWQGVYMPEILQIEYPNAGKLLAWQYVFSANPPSHDPYDHKIRRYHVDAREFQRVLANAALAAGIDIRALSHSLRTGRKASPLFRDA